MSRLTDWAFQRETSPRSVSEHSTDRSIEVTYFRLCIIRDSKGGGGVICRFHNVSPGSAENLHRCIAVRLNREPLKADLAHSRLVCIAPCLSRYLDTEIIQNYTCSLVHCICLRSWEDAVTYETYFILSKHAQKQVQNESPEPGLRKLITNVFQWLDLVVLQGTS